MWVMAGPAASRVLADHGAEVDPGGVDAPDRHRPHAGAVRRQRGRPREVRPVQQPQRQQARPGARSVQSAEPRGHAGPRALGRRRRRRVLAPRHGLPRAGPRGPARPQARARSWRRPASAVRPARCRRWPASGRWRRPCRASSTSAAGRTGRRPARSAPTPTTSRRATSCAPLLAALEHRRRTGQGQYVDYSQSEGSIHNLSSILLDYVVNGRIAERMGNDDDRFAPHGVYPSLGDDQWVAVVCETDGQWRALCAVLGGRARGPGGPDAGERLGRRRGAGRPRRRMDRDPAGGRGRPRRSRRRACPPTRWSNSPEAIADPQLAAPPALRRGPAREAGHDVDGGQPLRAVPHAGGHVAGRARSSARTPPRSSPTCWATTPTASRSWPIAGILE